MKRQSQFLFLFFTTLIGGLFFYSSLCFASKDLNIRYNLALSFDIKKAELSGTAKIGLPKGSLLTLNLEHLEITGFIIQSKLTPPAIIRHQGLGKITIPKKEFAQEIFISYKKNAGDDHDNFIGQKGITLLHNWYPFPSKDVLFSIKSTLPKNFKAITESDFLSPENDTFSFSEPTTTIHFIAAPFTISTLKVREGLNIFTYFYQDDPNLAHDYLKSCAGYIKKYEELIGPYPYNHFAVVENLRPTGYGMPTFALLGQRVLRLAFIKNTSLGHEVLHSWFGNSVKVKDGSGNWVEGLTSYLADHLYAEEKGEGASYRKNQTVKYLNYTKSSPAINLGSFFSASHNQPMARSVRSVGYIKGAMLFHELKQYIGETPFFNGIKLLYSNYRGRHAGWQELIEIFEETSKIPLDHFFLGRLTSTDIPNFAVNKLEITSQNGVFLFSFTIEQKSSAPFQLHLPFTVTTPFKTIHFSEKIEEKIETIEVKLPTSPTSLTIDPGYDILRTLGENENIPVWSAFLSSAPVTVLAGKNKKQLSASLLKLFSNSDRKVQDVDTASQEVIRKNNIIFLGVYNTLCRSLFGPIQHPAEGVTLEVRRNPLNNEKLISLVSVESESELEKILHKLKHYGKYSHLHFQNGRIKEKKLADTEMGIKLPVEQAPSGFSSPAISSFADIITSLENSNVIYIGEKHTSMSDHHLQFQIIEALFSKGHKLAIGFEMFQASQQQVLDQFIHADNDMNEKEFLKKSQYFKSWKYDYRYYKQIIDFAKKHTIPLIGLNIDRKIVSTVFQEGTTDKLTPQQQEQLPKDLVLDMQGYRRRLQNVHNYHTKGGHGSGDLSGFIQAQAIWDETMAEKIAQFYKKNPYRKIIVLAGAQHTRGDDGIPPRVLRRINVNQKTILSMENFGGDTQIPSDFYIKPLFRELAPTGRIGVTLEEKKTSAGQVLQIMAVSPEAEKQEVDLKIFDFLLSINDYSVKTLEDVQIAMIDALPGDEVQLRLKRENEPTPFTISVKLHAPRNHN